MYIGTPLSGADCHGSVGRTALVQRRQKFYAVGISGPAAITCEWRIPKTATGKLLRGWAQGLTASGGTQGSGLPYTWRVRR